jgi:hypothetical protein
VPRQPAVGDGAGARPRHEESVKYEEIHPKEHATITALQSGIQTWFNRCSHWRPHENLGNLTPAHDKLVPAP